MLIPLLFYFRLYAYFCFGFILGNLFGNLVVIIRFNYSAIGNIAAILTIVSTLEVISYLNKFFEYTIWKSKLNALRVGILIGFCIDAFKVGS